MLKYLILFAIALAIYLVVTRSSPRPVLVGECSGYTHALAACRPFMCSHSYNPFKNIRLADGSAPFTETTLHRYVNGFQNGVCVAWEELPGSSALICGYRNGNHKLVAEEEERFSQELMENGGKMLNKATIRSDSDLQKALDSGECRIVFVKKENTVTQLFRISLLDQFRCLGAECEDTCCKAWGMQVNPQTVARYRSEAPELLEAVTESDNGTIMKRNPQTSFCVKYDNGLCSIHRDYGDRMLGDACHFYPRATRQLGEDHLHMTASLSCPEVVRLMLKDQAYTLDTITLDRTPELLKTYRQEGMTGEAMLSVHRQFIAQVEAQANADSALLEIMSATRSLTRISPAQWQEAAGFTLRMAAGRILPAEPDPMDSWKLLQYVMTIIGATGNQPSDRLYRTVEQIANYLGSVIDWQTLTLHYPGDITLQLDKLRLAFQRHHTPLNQTMHHWLTANLSLMCLPFSGFGNDLIERINLLAVRYALTRLALLTHNDLPEDATVHVIQSLARQLDHLADPTLSLQMLEQYHWQREGQINGLIRPFP